MARLKNEVMEVGSEKKLKTGIGVGAGGCAGVTGGVDGVF